MPVFIVAPDTPNTKEFAEKISSVVPAGNSIKLPGGVWLVSSEGTTRTLSDALGLSEGNPVSGVVLSVGSYWGRATKDVWEWIEQKNK